MANSSNPPDGSARMQDHEYLYASNANVSNFVSVKLSGGRNYHLWKKQMQCLMKTHDFYNLVEDDGPARDPETMNKIIKYDSLLQGWILGSLCEEVLGIVVNCNSAKEVWLELKRYFDSTEQETKDKNAVLENTTANDKGGNPAESEAKGKEATQIETKGTKTDDKVSLKKPLTDAISVDIPTEYKDTNSTESKAKCEDATETEIKDSDSTKEEKEVERKDENAEMKDWEDVLYELFYSGNKVIKTEQINKDANNALHIAVGLHRNDMIMEVLPRIVGELTGIRDSKGRTLLHVAAVVDNTDAAELLIKRDSKLLDSIDIEKKTPLDVAYDHMHLDTITCLLESAEAERKRKKAAGNVEIKRKGSAADVSADSPQLYVETGVKVLVNAISAKQYNFADTLITRNPIYVTYNDNVLMAMARTFPSGLDYEETLIYPIPGNIRDTIVKRSKRLLNVLGEISFFLIDDMSDIITCQDSFQDVVLTILSLIINVPAAMVYLIYLLLPLLLLMVYYPFSLLYHLLWKVASPVVPPIRNIEQKKNEYDKAKMILGLVCKTIKETYTADRYHSLFKRPFLEAACQNASEVVDEILKRWPEAIRCIDENGYDIIQLATIHRSEKVYSLINSSRVPKSNYRTKKDSSGNNMLHLAGRLAPSNKLKLRTGAALQLQRELQWREEVKKRVYPSNVTAVNIFNETPAMVFTKEHENLVKEGETWIKTVAESCSISATLITTIVFAAAITVPGGTRQETGVPVFMKEVAFIVFAISDAISLFSSTTALLLFLSILTARFAEEDFLISLPRRLIIGLCTLLISTAGMMVAFGATLFLVFCHDKMWLLIPICGLAFLPIAMFCILQVPLIIDLIRSTYISMFGKDNHKSSNFDPSNMRFFFGK